MRGVFLSTINTVSNSSTSFETEKAIAHHAELGFKASLSKYKPTKIVTWYAE